MLKQLYPNPIPLESSKSKKLRTFLTYNAGKNEEQCQEWDLNPCPFGPVPETGALDQLGHLDLVDH